MKLNRPMIGRLVLALLAVAAWFLARERLERKREAAEKTNAVRVLQIKRVREENTRLRESVRDGESARRAAEGDREMPVRGAGAIEREIGLREVAELRRLGVVSIVEAAAVNASGSWHNPLLLFSGERVGPAFVRTFGLSTGETTELQAAYDQARSKIAAAGASAVTTRWEPNGSFVIAAKRVEESQIYVRELKEAFVRVMGAERFALFEGLVSGTAVFTEADGGVTVVSTGLDRALISSRARDEQMRITRRSEGGVVGYKLEMGGHDGGWIPWSLPSMPRGELLSRLGPLARYVPPDF
jgi:hypothetical protein